MSLPPQPVERKPIPNKGFDDLVSEVELTEGVIHIGFIKTTDDDREQMSRTSPETERMAEEIQSGSNSIAMCLFGALGRRFLVDVVTVYTHTLSYLHCEIALPLSTHGTALYGSNHVMAIGVNAREGVFVRPRKFHDEYTWSAVKCGEESMRSMLHFVYGERGKLARATTNVVLYPGPEKRDKYTCAQLVMACLEFLPLPVFHFNPGNKLTVDELFDLVSRRENAPTQMAKLTETQAKRVYGEASMRGPQYRPANHTVQLLQNPV